MNSVTKTLAAVLLLAAAASAMPKPEGPLTLFAHERLHSLVRAQKDAGKAFKGTYTGKFEHFGSSGTYRGDFAGRESDKQTTVQHTGKAVGHTDSAGMSGRFSVDYAGRIVASGEGKFVTIVSDGRFDCEFKGRYNGHEAFAKSVGTYRGTAAANKWRITEKGSFNMRVAKKNVKGIFSASFDGMTYAVKLSGTIDGKKFALKYQIMLEDFMKYIKNEGEYTITIDGKTKTGTFDGKDAMMAVPSS